MGVLQSTLSHVHISLLSVTLHVAYRLALRGPRFIPRARDT